MKSLKEKGITLVALVVTIVIMLILAGITLNIALGDNGLLKQAKKAVEKYKEAQEQENNSLSSFERQLDGIGNKIEEKRKVEVNKPNLAEAGMIPIKYDETKGKWVITNENDEEWYDYSEGTMKWANVMLSDGKYKTSQKENYKEDGSTVVEEADLGSMFVWIPRYAYSINKYHTTSDQKEGTTQKITNVVFLNGTSNRDFEENSYETSYNVNEMLEKVGQPTPMIVHPGFNFGGKELTGIWVAKFEASMNRGEKSTGNDDATNKTVTVLPNVETWRYISVGNSFINCYNMKNSGNEYGLNENEIDTHLMKNMEWGIVAYLSSSQYGIVPTVNSKVETSSSENIVIYNFFAGGKDYKANKSQSTTGNVTGIYDMCGGGWEWAAAYYNNLDQNLKLYGKYAFTDGRELNTTYAKYWDKYEVDTEERTVTNVNETYRNYTIWDAGTEGNQTRKNITDKKYNLMKNKLGDAMYETIGVEYSYYGKVTIASEGLNVGDYSWMKSVTGASQLGTGYYNGDYALIDNCALPFAIRGSNCGDGTYAGIFALGGSSGDPNGTVTFRPVIAV